MAKAKRHERQRTISRYEPVINRLLPEVGELVTEDDLTRSATDLELIIEGESYLSTEIDLGAVLDYAIYEARPEGGSAVERYLEAHPPAPGSTEERALRAMAESRFSIFLVNRVEPRVGVELYDLLGGPVRFLANPLIATDEFLGSRVAARVVTVEDATMLLGAPLPLDQPAADDILDALLERFPDREPEELHDLPPDERRQVTATIAGIALDSADWLLGDDFELEGLGDEDADPEVDAADSFAGFDPFANPFPALGPERPPRPKA